MDGTILGLIFFVVATFAAALVAGLAGFAFGLVAAAVWLHVLPPIQTATPIVAYGLIVQGYAVWTPRRALQWTRLWPFLLGGVFGVPVGVAILGAASPSHVRMGIGAFLVLYSITQRRTAMTTTFKSARKLLAVGVATLILSGAAMAQTVTFENDTVGSLPKDFEFGLAGEGGPGRWQVVADATAAGGKALAQLTTNPVAHRFLVAIYKPVVMADGEITARCKPLAGKTDQACGVIVRAIDARNYYIARSNVLEENVRFYRIRNGQREQLATAEKVKIPNGQWQTLTLRVEGDRYTVVFNGKTLHTTTDTTKGLPRPAMGRVGLWTKADSVSHFDRIDIKTLP